MKEYIIKKKVKATPALLKGGVIYLPTDAIPRSMVPVVEGYKVMEENGHEYFVPKAEFEQDYKCVETLKEDREAMDFGDAIEVLKQGGAIRRKGWNGKGMFVIKQVPAHIDSNIIPKMQSLPQSAKDIILKGKGFIDYTSQCLIYNENTGRADSWNPSIADVFAEDWEILYPEN